MPSLPQKPVAPPPPGTQAGASGVREPQITVIPEPYYGAALQLNPPFLTDEDDASSAISVKMPAPTPAPIIAPAPAVLPPPSPEHHSRLWLIGLVVLVLLGTGGVWVAWNRDVLFGKKPIAPIAIAKPVAPNAPTDLTVISPTPGAVRLNWLDHSQTEAGFRIERKATADAGPFTSIQTLPVNSQSFFDPTAPAGTTSTYRVIAFNPGGDSFPSNEMEIGVMAVPPAPLQAPTLPPDGLDSDSDGLTDVEEAMYTSNPHLPDTDGDGYLDGNEVFNLYSPTVKAPSTLLGQANMQVVSSTIGWQTILPKVWIIETTSTSSDVRAHTLTGESFVFRIEANANKQEIHGWLLTQKGIRADQITELQSNKFKVPFYLGPDRMTAYIPWEDRVLVVTYQLGTQTFVNYRTTFGLILNALRLTGSPKVPDLSTPTPIPAIFQTASIASSTTMITSSSTIPFIAVPSSTAATSSRQ